jgi:predicted RNA-binding Zn ribbon-like protein
MPDPEMIYHPYHTAGAPQWEHAPRLGVYWTQYFPDVPVDERESYPYPVPRSESFWRLYAEPVNTFAQAVLLLRDAIKRLLSHGQNQHPSDQEKLDVLIGKQHLNHLTSGGTSFLEPTAEGTWRQTWSSPSLLTSLAMMVSFDLADKKRRFLRCKKCGELFTTTAWQARYCSETCRNRVQKRRFRHGQLLNAPDSGHG